MSVRAKFFLSFLTIAILPSSILILFYYHNAKADLERIEFRNLQIEAEKIAGHIDTLLSSNVNIVRHLSHSAQLFNVLVKNSEISSERVRTNQWLDRQVAIHPELYAAFYVMNREGLCVSSSQRDFIGQDYSFRPYFQNARQGEPSLTDLFIGVTSYVPGIYASTPVFSDENEVVGVLVLKFDAAYIFRSIQSLAEHKGLAGFVVNNMGIMLTHSSPEYAYHSLAPLSPEEIRDIESIRQFANLHIEPLELRNVKEHLFGKREDIPQTFSYSLDGRVSIGTAVAMAEEPWFVVVSKSLESSSRFSNALFVKTSSIAFAIVMLIIPVAYVLSTKVFIQALEPLFKATKQIERGEYGQYVPVRSHDEIGSLTQAFNKMSESLQEYREHLEERVEERSRKLLESEANYRLFFDSVPVGIGLIDSSGRILQVNRNIVNMLGYSKDALNGMPVNAVYIDAEDRRKIKGVLQKNGKARDWETRLQRQDGIVFHALLNVDQIEWNGQKVLLISIRDISEQKRTEWELKKAKEAAETASLVKSEFLANMSHELRTPLNGILGYAQILGRDSSLTDLQNERVAFIERSGNHLLTLINDILDLAKIEAGKLDIIPTEFRLPVFLKDIIEMIQIKAQQKGLKFLYEPPENLQDTLYADEIRLRQILLNLLGNAVKFTPKGSIRFRVTHVLPTEKQEQQKDDDRQKAIIRFEVEDSGVGIPPEQIEMVFQSFEQLRQKDFLSDGAGLGLAISRRLAQMLGSEIFVESVVGKGSRFWLDVEFPKAPTGGQVLYQGAKPHITRNDRLYFQEIIGFKGEKRTILLLDNKQENRVVLRDMLSPLGFDVLEASEGEEGIKVAKAFHPDLILMDLNFPEKNGFQTIYEIRQDPELQNVPAIAVSASVQKEVRQQCIEAGFHGFIEKPVHFELLLETLTVFLQVEWSYASSVSPDERRTDVHTHENVLLEAFPPAEELRALQKLVTRGMVLEIRRSLERLEKADSALKPFAEKIHRMNKEFRFEDIEALLQQALQQEDRHER